MTFTGRLSRGCYTCRQRRVKCDEGRPRCARCTRARRVCAGYRDEDDLSFRHETESTYRRVRDDSGTSSGEHSRRHSKSRRSRSSQSSTPSSSSPRDLIPLPSYSRRPRSSIPVTLPTPVSQEALAYLFANMSSLPTERNFLHFLPNIYSTSRSDTPLAMAIDAVALALLSGLRTRQHLFPLAQNNYLKALAATQRAIADPEESLCDETLASVLLLAQYENFSLGDIVSWETHMKGAAAMVHLRGEKQLRTAFGQALSSAVHHRLIIAGVFRPNPPERIPNNLLPQADRSNANTSHVLADRLKALQDLLKELSPHLESIFDTPRGQISGSEPLSPERARRVHGVLERVDEQLVEWAERMPAHAQYQRLEVKHLDDPRLCPGLGYVDIYQNAPRCAEWNMYRGGRILLHQLIMIVLSQIPNAATDRPFRGPDSSRSRSPEREINPLTLKYSASIIRRLATEIAASVPPLLGFEPSGHSSPNTQLPTFTISAQFLLWPLYVLSHCTLVPLIQRNWAQERLKYINEELGLRRAGKFTQSIDTEERPLDVSEEVNMLLMPSGGPLALLLSGVADGSGFLGERVGALMGSGQFQ